MPNDFMFDLARHNTFASLSASDLEGLGKRASQLFLSMNVPLNEAVIKLAREHPGISQEQVKRVVEFANTETFQRLFEKQAGDKNIEFKIADPQEVLRAVNASAGPQYVKVAAAEYAKDPVKTAQVNLDVLADLRMMEVFGVQPSTEILEKVAEMQGQQDLTDSTSFLDQMPPGDTALQKGIEYALAEKTRGDGMGNYDALSSVLDAVKNTAETMSTQPNPKEMLKAQEDAMKQQAKGMAGMGDPAAAGGGAAGGAPPAPAGAPMPPQGAGPVELNPPGPGGALTPPEMPNTQGMKIASLVKEAEAYTRLGRPDSGRVLDDLRLATSLEHIKAATQNVGDYPESNPYGDLIRTKQGLEKMAEDGLYAKSKNQELMKEAESEFAHHVVQELLGGSNLGAIAHAMSAAGSPEHVKTALAIALPVLVKKGFDLGELQARAIAYEMEKGAELRTVNSTHPLVELFGAMMKLADGQKILDISYEEVSGLLKEADGILGRAMGAIGNAARRFTPGMMKAEGAIARSGAEASQLIPKPHLVPGANPPITVRSAIRGPARQAATAVEHAPTGLESTAIRQPVPHTPPAEVVSPERLKMIEEPVHPRHMAQNAGTTVGRPPAAAPTVAAPAPQAGGLGRKLKRMGIAAGIAAPVGMGAVGFSRGFGTQGGTEE